MGGGGARRERRRDDGHRLGEVSRLLAAGARRDRARAHRARALPLSDEGPRAGSGALARPPRPAHPAARDLRRRHAGGAARACSAHRERDPHEPGHAASRRPPTPRPLGRRPPQPARRRGRRGPRVPRRVRLARRERPPAAATAGARVRQRAGLRARDRDDRERRRARVRADRARRSARHDGHVAARRARGRALEPRVARPGARARARAHSATRASSWRGSSAAASG